MVNERGFRPLSASPTRVQQAGDWGVSLLPGPAAAHPTPLRFVLPILVRGVERRIEVQTNPNPAAGRPFGLYGNRCFDAPISPFRLRPRKPLSRESASCGYRAPAARSPDRDRNQRDRRPIAAAGYSARALLLLKCWTLRKHSEWLHPAWRCIPRRIVGPTSPSTQRPRKTRDDAVIPPQAPVALFPRYPPDSASTFSTCGCRTKSV